jgi:acyl dehydratase
MPTWQDKVLQQQSAHARPLAVAVHCAPQQWQRACAAADHELFHPIPPDQANPMTPTDLSVDVDARYFEDYPPGAVAEYGPIAVDEEDIIAFGRQFDPQPFHVDRQRAAGGPFGGVVASGWHTASLMMRLLVDHYLPRKAGLGSPGIDELRWLRPVRPGDQLSLRITVTEATRSRTKPDRGLVRTFNEVINQRGEPVMTLKAMTLVRCRSVAVEAPAP